LNIKRGQTLSYLGEIFDDWLMRASGIIFVLIVMLVIFNVCSDLPEKHLLFGLFSFCMVPILFIVGGVIFSLAISREIK